jgi:hypothetical protein
MDPARMRELLSRLSCPLCGGMRDDTLLVVINATAGAGTIVRAQCVRCHLSWAFPIEDAPFPTIWKGEPASDEPISADEVIELHRLLDGYEGSLVDLVSRSG